MSESEIVDITIPAMAVADDELTVHSPAEIGVTASYGEFNGIIIAATRPDIPTGDKYTSVEVTIDGAREIIASITTAATSGGAFSQMTDAEACYDDSRASVEVASDPSEFAGIYLGLLEHDLMSRAGLLIDDEQAQAVIDALTTAINYLLTAAT
jgi:hypothetical protein